MVIFGTLFGARTFLSDPRQAQGPTAMTMKRARFVEDAKLDPGRYYRPPTDIIRDRRLSKEDRLEIVRAWEQRLESADDLNGSAEKLGQLQRLREELQQSAG